MGMQIGNGDRWRTITAGVAMKKNRMTIAAKGVQRFQRRGKGFVETLTIEISDRRAVKFHLVRAAFGDQRGKIESFDRQIFGVLQAEDRGNAEFLSEPGNVFHARIFSDEKGGENFAHFRSSRAAI